MSQSDYDWEQLNRKEKILKEAARILSVSEKDLPRVVERFMNEIREMESKN